MVDFAEVLHTCFFGEYLRVFSSFFQYLTLFVGPGDEFVRIATIGPPCSVKMSPVRFTCSTMADRDRFDFYSVSLHYIK